MPLLTIDDLMHAYNEGYKAGLDQGAEDSDLFSADIDKALNDAFDDGYLQGAREGQAGIAEPLIEEIMADRAAEAAELAYEDAFQEAPRFHANVEGAITTTLGGEVFNELVLKHAIANSKE